MKKIRVLFVGGGKRYSAAEKLVQAGEEMGCPVEIYAYEMGVGLPIADIATVIPGKAFAHPEVLYDLEQKIGELNIDIALPYHDAAIPLLARLSHAVFVPTCNYEMVQIFSSKIQSSDFFRNHGIPVPTYTGNIPAIAKPNFGSASKGLLTFTKQDELDSFMGSSERKKYEIQDLVSGPEYSVDGYIALNSDFRHFAVRQRIETLGGEVVRSQTVAIPEVEACCHQISEISGVRGAITLQFIFDNRSNSYKIMEINPRFGGGMLTTWGAGVPWFNILLRDYWRISQVQVCHTIGVLMVRSFREHYFRL